jgi:hypothetical protein
MRHQHNTLFVQLSKEAFAQLTVTVNEVIAVDFKNSQQKVFSAADLWNIQRQKRNFVQRRNRF